MNNIALSNILFIDIETVSKYNSYDDLSDREKEHWNKKVVLLKSDKPADQLYFERAGIYAEFGKIICIGIGGIDKSLNKIKLKAICSKDEKEVLLEFKRIIENHPAKKNLILCAHNGKEFDFPYICRRMLINGIELPDILDISEKKPWEVMHRDTLEMWKFGDFKNYTSLDLLATIFDIPGSKYKMDGSMVNFEYYEKDNLQEIAEYCKEDVKVLIQLYLKMKNVKSLNSDN